MRVIYSSNIFALELIFWKLSMRIFLSKGRKKLPQHSLSHLLIFPHLVFECFTQHWNFNYFSYKLDFWIKLIQWKTVKFLRTLKMKLIFTFFFLLASKWSSNFKQISRQNNNLKILLDSYWIGSCKSSWWWLWW